MSSEWRSGRLGDFIELKRGYDLPQAKREKGSIPLISSSGHSDYHSEAKVPGPGVVTGRYGTIGQVFYVEQDFWPLNTTLYVKDFKGNDPKYIHYFLKTIDFLAYSDKAAVPGVNRNHLHEALVNLPDVNLQIEIAGFLGALDDRIALLRETNATLEAIAQALFKSWFVDFDPVHANAGTQAPSLPAEIQALFPSRLVESPQGLIPEGWEWSTIGDVCEFQNGYAFKSNEMSKNSEDTFKIFKMGNIKKGGGLNRSGTKDFYEKSKAHSLGRYLIKKGDLLMCMTDMKNNVALLGHTALMDNSDEFLLNQRVGLLRTKNVNILNYPFLYILTNSAAFLDDLRARANSGVQVNLSTSEIKATSFLLPPKAIHAQFNELVEQLFESMFANDQKQECLIELRDTLLPRLISGQLRLPEAEAALAGVG